MSPPEWNFGHVAGLCDVAFLGSGDETRLVTCGADNTVALRDPKTGDVEDSFEDHDDAVNVLAVHPDGAKFATGSDDNCVKLFSFTTSKREFESNVTRFTLPVRALAFSNDGALLAAGGEDSTIKVINMADNSVHLELPTNAKCVKSIAFDPIGEYVAAVDDTGVLTVWALKEIKAGSEDNVQDDDDDDDDGNDGSNATIEAGERVLCATTAPTTEADSTRVNGVSWRPDGAVVAVPGRENDVTFFARGSWRELEDHRLFADAKGHAGAVATCRWSPNGKYLLTTGADNAAVVWDVGAKSVVSRIECESIVCGAYWRKEGNAVALAGSDGQWCVWNDVVAASLPSPTAVVDASELDFFVAGAKKEDVANAAEGGDVAGALEDDDDEEGLGDMDEEEYYLAQERRRKMKRKMAGKFGGAFGGAAAAPTPQAPFQVGACDAAKKPKDGEKENRRFLCYNMIGTVVTTGEPGGDFNSVEMSFHDTSRAGRAPTITDYHGYSIGTLGEKGCALASPGKPGGGASTVFYRPYESWAHASEWRVTLPSGEDAVSVAAGYNWVAAVTSKRNLRLFSHAGAQRQIVTLEGAPVTCVGKGDSLVVTWHAAAPALVPGADGRLEVEQRIEFAEYDVADGGKILSRGRVPVPPGHTLTWLGHSEDDNRALCFGASDGTVRVRVPDFGGSWSQVFSSMDARQSEGEHHWVVAVATSDNAYSSSALYCVVCRDASGPGVYPKPVQTLMPLGAPVALPENSSGDLEDAAAKAQIAVALASAAAARDGDGDGDGDGADDDDDDDARARARDVRVGQDAIPRRLAREKVAPPPESPERHAAIRRRRRRRHRRRVVRPRRGSEEAESDPGSLEGSHGAPRGDGVLVRAARRRGRARGGEQKVRRIRRRRRRADAERSLRREARVRRRGDPSVRVPRPRRPRTLDAAVAAGAIDGPGGGDDASWRDRRVHRARRSDGGEG